MAGHPRGSVTVASILSMLNEAPRVEIDEELRLKALKPLERMLELSPPAKDGKNPKGGSKAAA